MEKRRRFKPEFKAEVVLEVLREEKTLSEIAADYGVHPNQLSRWKAEFIRNASRVFSKETDEEDGLTDKAYFNAVYKEATELCAYLCKEYNLDPMADGVIIGHYEGHRRGIASNHADPGHWFPKHGKSMDTFRAEVQRLLKATEPSKPPTPTPTEPKKLYRLQVGAYAVKSNADAMLKRVKAAGFMDAFIKYS
jgi:transposase-like protein